MKSNENYQGMVLVLVGVVQLHLVQMAHSIQLQQQQWHHLPKQ